MQPDIVQQLSQGLQVAFRRGDPSVDAKTIERDHVSLLEQQYRAIGEGRFATTFYDSLAEDVELEILGPPDCPFLGHWTGRDQVYAAVERNFGLIETQLPLIESVVAQGDTVVVIGRETGRYREPAAEYRVAWVQVMTFAGGRIQRLQEFVTPVLD